MRDKTRFTKHNTKNQFQKKTQPPTPIDSDQPSLFGDNGNPSHRGNHLTIRRVSDSRRRNGRAGASQRPINVKLRSGNHRTSEHRASVKSARGSKRCERLPPTARSSQFLCTLGPWERTKGKDTARCATEESGNKLRREENYYNRNAGIF